MKKLFALAMMPIIIWIEINVSSEKCKGMYLEIFLMQLSSLIVEGLKQCTVVHVIFFVVYRLSTNHLNACNSILAYGSKKHLILHYNQLHQHFQELLTFSCTF